MMSRINTSSGDGNGSIAFIAPSVTMNSIRNLDSKIETLIKLVTGTEDITGGGYLQLQWHCINRVSLRSSTFVNFYSVLSLKGDSPITNNRMPTLAQSMAKILLLPVG